MAWTSTRSVDDAPPMTAEDVFRILKRRPRVLLADDDDEVRWSLAAFLSVRGYEVETVANGLELKEVLERCASTERVSSLPDVVVTDVRMPGLNGLKALAQMRSAGIPTPVFVISAFADQSMRDHVSGLEDAELFEKPLDIEALEASLLRAACGCTPD